MGAEILAVGAGKLWEKTDNKQVNKNLLVANYYKGNNRSKIEPLLVGPMPANQDLIPNLTVVSNFPGTGILTSQSGISWSAPGR